MQPFIAFGRALTAAGHEVRLATHPRFAEAVASQGLDFAPLAEGHLSQGVETAEGRRWIETGSKRLPTWVGFLRDARSVAARRLADAATACADAQAVVASNLAMVLGWQMADHRNVPLVRAFIGPPAWMLSRRPVHRLAPLVRQVAWVGARPWLNGVRRRSIGLGPLPWREPFTELDRQRMPILYAFSPAVLPGPPVLGDLGVITGFWFLEDSIDSPPPPGLPEFLAAGPPPVSVGFSTMIDDDPPARARLLIAAVREAGVRGVIQVPAEHLRGTALPADVFAAEQVSHQWLFPRCAAVVHHGAVGTTAAALAAGIPAVAIPHMTDQFVWARRLHELGVGPAPIPRRELTVQRLADAIRRVMNDESMRVRAQGLSAEIGAEDGVATAVETFEHTVVRRYGNPSPVASAH